MGIDLTHVTERLRGRSRGPETEARIGVNMAPKKKLQWKEMDQNTMPSGDRGEYGFPS